MSVPPDATLVLVCHVLRCVMCHVSWFVSRCHPVGVVCTLMTPAPPVSTLVSDFSLGNSSSGDKFGMVPSYTRMIRCKPKRVLQNLLKRSDVNDVNDVDGVVLMTGVKPCQE